MRVVIRVDSSRLIGSGHVMRCLTLADKLQRAGARVLFLCRDLPGHCYNHIKQRGHQLQMLAFENHYHYETLPPNDSYLTWLGVSLQQDADDTIACIKNNPVDLLITDMYALDSDWQQRVRPYVYKLMVIDDLANRKHDCDIIFDHNYYLNASTRYDELVPSACKKFLGAAYALIDDKFFQVGERRKKTNANRSLSLQKILVFLGGVDIKNHSQLVLEGLLASSLKNCQINMVLGGANSHAASLKKQYKAQSNIVMHVQPDYYLQLMEETDLAIGSGSVSALERLAAHVPSVLIKTAENQAQVCQDLSTAGLAVYAHDALSLASVFNSLSVSDLTQLSLNNPFPDLYNPLLTKELMHACVRH